MILTAGPSITQKEIDYVTDAITNGHGAHWGDYIKRFETAFAEYIGVKHAMTTSSCTGAMHLALVALGIGPGDEVIVPDTTWIATASVVRYVGATPVFADIDPESWCISPDSITRRITPNTRVIIPVHLYGQPADMSAILEIAYKYNLYVLEDAAPSVGATYAGRHTGAFGDVAAFSFQGAKIVSTGEGGMLVTDNTDLFNRVKHFAEHGRSGNGFEISDIGYKYKMSNLQAAWGLAQIERVEELVAKRRQIYRWYAQWLGEVPGIQLNKPPNDIEQPIFWMTSVVIKRDDISRDEVMAKLKECEIDTRPIFPPMSSFGMFDTADNPVAQHIGARGINLPSFHDITEDQVSYICGCLEGIMG